MATSMTGRQVSFTVMGSELVISADGTLTVDSKQGFHLPDLDMPRARALVLRIADLTLPEDEVASMGSPVNYETPLLCGESYEPSDDGPNVGDLWLALEAAHGILWMAERYAESVGENGQETRAFRVAARKVCAALGWSTDKYDE